MSHATFMGTIPSENLKDFVWHDVIGYRADKRLDELDKKLIRTAADGYINRVIKLYETSPDYKRRIDRLHRLGYIYPDTWEIVTMLPVNPEGEIWSPERGEIVYER